MVRCIEGKASRNRIPVLDNVYDIPARLKSLSRSFFVMFNTLTQKFEIHSSDDPYDTFECALPFDELDARAIEYARKYSAARLEETAREVELHNERLEKSRYKEMLDKANYKTKEVFNYLKNNSKTDAVPMEVVNE